MFFLKCYRLKYENKKQFNARNVHFRVKQFQFHYLNLQLDSFPISIKVENLCIFKNKKKTLELK